MRVLLTGVTGRIGVPVLRGLVDAGHGVDVLSRSALPELVDGVVGSVTWGDVTDPDAWRAAVSGVDAVVHLAGISGERGDAMRVNVRAAQVMARACVDADVGRVVFASSNCVLGHCDRPADTPFAFRYLPVDEDHPVQHVTAYGRSKLNAEHVLREATRRSSLRVVALRPAWVWRPQEISDRRSDAYDESASASSLWAYVMVDDFADAVTAALVSDRGEAFEALYLSAADTTADTPTAALVRRFLPTLAGHADRLSGHDSLFSSRRAAAVIGYHPTRSWRA